MYNQDDKRPIGFGMGAAQGIYSIYSFTSKVYHGTQVMFPYR